jgi:hypothetical protein
MEAEAESNSANTKLQNRSVDGKIRQRVRRFVNAVEVWLIPNAAVLSHVRKYACSAWAAERYYRAEALAVHRRSTYSRPSLVQRISELEERLGARIENIVRAEGASPESLARLTLLTLILEDAEEEMERGLLPKGATSDQIAAYLSTVNQYDEHAKYCDHWKKYGIRMRDEAFRSIESLDERFAKKLRERVSSMLEVEFGDAGPKAA